MFCLIMHSCVKTRNAPKFCVCHPLELSYKYRVFVSDSAVIEVTPNYSRVTSSLVQKKIFCSQYEFPRKYEQNNLFFFCFYIYSGPRTEEVAMEGLFIVSVEGRGASGVWSF